MILFSLRVFFSLKFYQYKITLLCHSYFTFFVSKPFWKTFYEWRRVCGYLSTASSYITVLAAVLPCTSSLFSISTFLFSSFTSLFPISISLFSWVVYFFRGNVSLYNYINTESKSHNLVLRLHIKSSKWRFLVNGLVIILLQLLLSLCLEFLTADSGTSFYASTVLTRVCSWFFHICIF